MNYTDTQLRIALPVHICPNTHIFALTEATWQQRTVALARVKGVEIV